MRIVKIEDLDCNAGWRDFSFLKITADKAWSAGRSSWRISAPRA
jgi:hypothetical protein